MKKYEEYKEYLYDWLPTIPKHWQEISLRGLFYLSDERYFLDYGYRSISGALDPFGHRPD